MSDASESPRSAGSTTQLQSVLFLILACLCVAGVFGYIKHAESKRLAAGAEAARRSVLAAARATRAPGDRCATGLALANAISSATQALGAVETSPFPSIRESRAVLVVTQRSCCEARVATLIASVARVVPPEFAEGRAVALERIGASLVAEEGGFAVLPMCGHSDLAGAMTIAAGVERVLQPGSQERWKAASEVDLLRRRDAALANVLYPGSRNVELAAACIEGGISAGLEAQRAGNSATAATVFGAVLECTRLIPGAEITAAQQRAAQSGLAAAQRQLARDAQSDARAAQRENQAAQRVNEATGRAMQNVARRCMTDCINGGDNAWDCSASCARQHPEVVDWSETHY